MREIDHYVAASSDRAGCCVIAARQDQARVAEVRGCLLEAQFELADGSRLLWLTDDSPHDEGLHIHLLGEAETVEDSLEAGTDFAAGILKFIQIGERTIEFSFFLNAATYRLEVGVAACQRLRLPAGWRYERRFKPHRLTVSVTHTPSGD